MVTSPDGGALVRILAGQVAQFAGPGISHTPLAITHVTLAPGAEIEIPWRKDFNALAYVLTGDGAVGAELRPFGTGQMAVLADGDTVKLRANQSQESRSPNLDVFLIGGVPLREPVFQYGPFVMSTKAEVMEAFEDFQAGRFGHIPADALTPHQM